MWSPKTRSDGHDNPFYKTMERVKAGDLVFSFADTFIKAIGIAQGVATTAPKPTEFGSAGANWTATGWLVPVQFTELKSQIRPKDHIKQLGPTLPAKYSPLQANGNGNQTVYLAEVPVDMAKVLIDLVGSEGLSITEAGARTKDEGDDDRAEAALRDRADIGPTTKAQLVQARRGQGLFRARVALQEPFCRLTKVTETAHLRASHMKPWSVSDDREKLDGANGLLLAPHVDHLFDKGFITFSDDGKLLVSQQLPMSVLSAWGIKEEMEVGGFRSEQLPYLFHHRSHVFRG